MAKPAIVPCLWMNDQAEAAAALYTELFPNSRVVRKAHYPGSFDNPSKKPRGSVMTVEFEVAGRPFTALNGGAHFTIQPSISFFAFADDATQATRWFERLATGGTALMPLGAYPWSNCYAWIQDAYGVSWQVMVPRQAATTPRIVPCLMFSAAQHGRAAEAMRTYCDVFPEARLDTVETYGPGEGPAGTVKHGRFTLAGQPFVAMDSHVSHDITFGEGLSLQVLCETQADVDAYWERLGAGGSHGPCGWLKDKFGVSWQIVPAELTQWMTHPEPHARDRVFAAMLQMGKLDLATLRGAVQG